MGALLENSFFPPFLTSWLGDGPAMRSVNGPVVMFAAPPRRIVIFLPVIQVDDDANK
jgi:hypothetical protein